MNESRSMAVRLSAEAYNELVALQKRLSVYATAALLKAGADGGAISCPSLGSVVSFATRRAMRSLDELEGKG